MRQFRDVVKEMDPHGLFANQFGVDMGLRWPALDGRVPRDTTTGACPPDDATPP